METRWAAFLSGGKKKTKHIFSMHLFGVSGCPPEPWRLGRHDLDCSHMNVCGSPTFLSSPSFTPAKARLSHPCHQPCLSTPALNPGRHWLSHFHASFSCGIILQFKFLGWLWELLGDGISFQPPDLISSLTPTFPHCCSDKAEGEGERWGG